MTSLSRLRRRLAAARRRVAYWSGRPSFGGYGCRGKADNALRYEQAMDDAQAIADEIGRLTGRRPKVTDCKAEFQERAAKTKW